VEPDYFPLRRGNVFFSTLKRLKKKRGVSLIEVLVALFLLSIALLALAQLVGTSTKLMAKSVNREKATLFAVQKIEGFEASSDLFDQPDGVISSDTEGAFSWEADLVDVEGEADFGFPAKRITLTVTWDAVAGDNSVVLERVVSPHAALTVSD
jgi:prepilin-type N-terminal cleavage/methylation domain-containing protein